nr:peptidoglycan-binding protein [Pseudomonas aeruginosa]
MSAPAPAPAPVPVPAQTPTPAPAPATGQWQQPQAQRTPSDTDLEKQHWDFIHSKVPDANQLIADPRLLPWVNKSPVRQRYYEKGTAYEVVQLLTDFKLHLASVPQHAPVTAPARPAPDETVRAVQQKLNELGYNAGPADGLMGRGTRAAIIAFQQDRGLAATGVADQTLLFQLRQVPSGSARGSGANAQSRSSPSATAPLFVPPTPSVQRSGPPANSWVSGSNWYCNDGYKKVGNSCEKLNVPRNAWVSGSNWYCNDGFKKVGDQCEALNVPANAWVSGSNWYCNDGYRKVGERCERLNVPQNAWVSGSNWYCNDGFRKVGDQCVALNVPANAWVSGSNWYCNDGYRKVGEKCVSVYER